MLKVLIATHRALESSLKAFDKDTVEHLDHNRPLVEQIHNAYDLILLDGRLDQISTLKSVDPRVEVLFFGDDEQEAVEAIKSGAAAYFRHPVQIEPLRAAVDEIRAMVATRRETGALEKQLVDKYTFFGLVGRNPQMLEIVSLIRRIAPYYKTVLITGETGTGKEVLAKALHRASPWAKSPFLVCNCGALVESLIESELFGHLKGSFTGADRDKSGLFEAAADGTLFLDEVGELPLSFQPRLLRVLQDGEFRRVGSNQASRARCRIIAATNRDLEADVKQGRFREDLFFRIAPLVLSIPPLRDRKDDLPLLCRVILERFRQRTQKPVMGISRPAQSGLMAHGWPGNVRELENILEQSAMMASESFIGLEDLPAGLRERRQDPATPLTLEAVERHHIQTVLARYHGNRTQAAKTLGLSRRALIRKIEKYGLGD